MAGKARSRTRTAKTASQMHGLYVRFECNFLLNDIRITRLDDASFRFYVLVESVALTERREVLPVEYDLDELAWRFRRDPDWAAHAREALTGGSDPLLEVLDDGRIWVKGVQKKHGNKIKWRDKPPTNDTRSSGDRPTNDGRSSDDRPGIADGSTPYPDVEPDEHTPQSPRNEHGANDGRSSGEPQQHDGTTAQPNQANGNGQRRSEGAHSLDASSPERQVFDSLTESWNGHGKVDDIRRVAHAYLNANPHNLLGLVLDIRKDGGVRSPWGVLQKRMRKQIVAPDAMVERAKALVTERVDGGVRPRSQPSRAAFT